MSNSTSGGVIPLVRSHLRRHGPRGTAEAIMQKAREKVYLQETHVWYELALGDERPKRSLSPEFELVRGDHSHLPLLDQLPDTPPEVVAKQRMDEGADLWLVLEGEQVAFVCWIFHGSMPMLAAPENRLLLAPEIVCLEDSVASTAYRGRGVAPAAWSGIAEALQQTGAKYIITKIGESNVASRRAIVKSGFHESASMHFRLVGFQRRTTVQPGSGATADWLAKQLQH